MPVPIKAALIALSAPTLISAVGGPRVGIDPSENPAIVRVDCDTSRGSAFFVSAHIAISVAHVTTAKGCEIAGEPIKVIESKGDFSLLYSKRGSGRWLLVDCEGYKEGRLYRGLGFARGLATLTEVPLEGTGAFKQGLALLDGIFVVVPGQSGGPVLNADGKVVGTVNAYWSAYGLSGSVELKQTRVCET